MLTVMVAIIVSLIIGTVTYTLWNWLWKKLKDPATQFDKSYLFSMLISILLTIVGLPFFLNNRPIPDMLLSFVMVGSGAIGFAANALFNTPLTYLMNKAAVATTNAVNEVTTVSRRIIEIVAVVLLIACILGASVYAVVSYTATMTSTGSITGVGVSIYADAQGTINLNQINWGNIPPGGSVTASIYVKSTSNVPITLTYSTSGWSPASLAPLMTLTWNYNNATIQPGVIIKIDLTLAASTSAPPGTSFTFNIVIVATG